MPNVLISDRELFGVAVHLEGPTWGGPRLMAQSELWAAIDAKKRFAKVKSQEDGGVDVGPLSAKPAPLKLSPDAVELLKEILQRPQQPRPMGMLSAAALARIGP